MSHLTDWRHRGSVPSLAGTFEQWYNRRMQSTKRPIAIVYRRVSTDKQNKSGLGLADQDKAIQEFCGHRALRIEGEFTEVESGRSDARPELEKALAMAKRRGGLLVIATLSRLGRRVSFISSLMDRGVPFACADAPDDEAFILHIKAAWAEEEARKISTRTRAGIAMLKANGNYSKTKGRVVTLGNPANLDHAARVRGAATVREKAAVEHAILLPEIGALRAQGLSIRAIADRVGVSPMTVSRLLAKAKSA